MKDQIADALIKALAQNIFVRRCKYMCGHWITAFHKLHSQEVLHYWHYDPYLGPKMDFYRELHYSPGLT